MSAITIVPYQPAWPGEFQKIGRMIREALREHALRIDHVGSTAVPGLAAKDIIDVQITVAGLEPAIKETLTAIGYLHRPHTHDHLPPGHEGQDDQWTKWMFKSLDDGRRANVHVRIAGRPNQRYALLFRDYLRAFPTIAQAYAATKMALARRHPDDADAYYDVKDPICDLIIGSAELWARNSGWKPGPSDC